MLNNQLLAIYGIVLIILSIFTFWKYKTIKDHPILIMFPIAFLKEGLAYLQLLPLKIHFVTLVIHSLLLLTTLKYWKIKINYTLWNSLIITHGIIMLLYGLHTTILQYYLYIQTVLFFLLYLWLINLKGIPNKIGLTSYIVIYLFASKIFNIIIYLFRNSNLFLKHPDLWNICLLIKITLLTYLLIFFYSLKQNKISYES